MGNTQTYQAENSIRTVVMGDVEKYVLLLDSNTLVYDLLKIISDNLELISPFNSKITNLSLHDFYIDINNMPYEPNNMLKVFGESIVVTVRHKYEISDYLEKLYNRAITREDRHQIIDARLCIEEGNLESTYLLYDTESSAELRLLQYKKYEKAKHFFGLVFEKNALYNEMKDLEMIIRESEMMTDENLKVIDKYESTFEEKSDLIIEKCTNNNITIDSFRKKVITIYNSKNTEYLRLKVEIDLMLSLIEVIEKDIDDYLFLKNKDDQIMTKLDKNDWLSKGGYWVLKFKEESNLEIK